MAKEIENIDASDHARLSQVAETRRRRPGGHGLELVSLDLIGHI
jgi:hypothetical protein